MTGRDVLDFVLADLPPEVAEAVEEYIRVALSAGECAGCGGPIPINPRGGRPRKFCTTCRPCPGPQPTACEVCGSAIEQARNGRRRFCSPCLRARRNADRRAKSRAGWKPIHCRYCGREIERGAAGRNRRYCDEVCKLAARRARERDA